MRGSCTWSTDDFAEIEPEVPPASGHGSSPLAVDVDLKDVELSRGTIRLRSMPLLSFGSKASSSAAFGDGRKSDTVAPVFG